MKLVMRVGLVQPYQRHLHYKCVWYVFNEYPKVVVGGRQADI